MRSWRKKRSGEDISDVHDARGGHRTRGVKSILYGKNVINLRPAFKSRHPWIFLGVLVLIILIAFSGFHKLRTKAEIKDLFPTTCLGDWQNPANAAGVPQTTADASTTFSADNSAIYATGTQLFCGGFLPSSIATSGTITNVALTLIWQIGDSPAASATTSLGVSDTSSSPPAPVSLPASTSSLVVPAPAPSTSSPTSLHPFRNFFAEFIPYAFADDSTNTVSTVVDTTIVTTTVQNSTTTIPPPLFVNLVPESSSPTSSSTAPSSTVTSSPEVATETVPVIPSTPPTPDNNFLQVSYSLDGQLWIELGKVNLSNWPNLTLTLPLTDWEQIKNLQLRVSGIPTTQNPIPAVYLDGMLLEVHYNISATDTTAKKDKPQFASFLTDKPQYTVGDTIHIVGAAESSSLELYYLDSQENPGMPSNVYSIKVVPGGSIDIDSNTLQPGRYIFVDTFEPDACGGYSLDDCRARSDFISESPVVISNQPSPPAFAPTTSTPPISTSPTSSPTSQ